MTLNYVELISLMATIELSTLLQNDCCCRLFRKGTFPEILIKTFEIDVRITPKLHNRCFGLIHLTFWVYFILCYKRKIGGKRFLSETSSRGKEFEKLKCFV